VTFAVSIDTSGDVGSVAVLSGDDTGIRVLAKERITDGMRRGVQLFPALARTLSAAGVAPRDLGLVAVGTGPGSYTGLRVGITSARALAYAAGAELLGVPSCDAWAHDVEESLEDAALGEAPFETLAVVTDARVRAVYLSLYARRTPNGGWNRTEGPEILEPAVAAARLPVGTLLVGDGPQAYPEPLSQFQVRRDPGRADAATVGRIALARHLAGERAGIDAVTPLYLRKTEAERKWERLHG